MAEGRIITVKIQVDERSAKKAGEDAAKAFKSGLSQVEASARDTGKRAGDAVGLGIEAGSRRATSALNGLRSAFAALGGAVILKQIGQAAIDAAVNLDKTRQAIAALVGGVDNANKKIAELRRLAAESPGVTTSFATRLYQQLRAVGTITDQTINKVIQGVGKLNSVFTIDNPADFARNLQQIFDQGFERGDIKEALGRVPIFEQLLQQAFGTKDPEKLRKLKEAGKLTAETYYSGIIEAVNQRFPKVSESIGAQFEKIKDRATAALEPLGRFLSGSFLDSIQILGPALNDLWDRMGVFAAQVGPELQKALVEALKLTISLIDAFLAFDKQTGVLNKAAFAFNALVGAQATFLRGLRETVAVIRDSLTPVINTLLAGIEVAGRFGSVLPGVGGAFGSAADVARDAYGAFNLNKAAGIITDNGRAPSLISGATSSLLGVFSSGGGGNNKKGGAPVRARSVTLPTLTADDLISSDAALQAEIAARESAIFRGRQTRTQLTAEFEAGERKDQIAQGRLTRKALTQDFEERTEALKKLEPVLSNGQRLMLGFANAVETTGDAFERLGQNISSSFRDVGNLLTNLKNALLSFFNDILGQSLQRVFGQILSPIAGALGGRGGFALPGGSSLFGGIAAPASVTATQQFTQSINALASPGSSNATGIFANGAFAAGLSGAKGGFSLGGLLGGLASAAPLLGAGIGAGLGGRSTLGNIAGAIGGGAVGLGLSYGGAILGAGGGLAQAALAFAGPAALIGAPLLVGAILLGKANQRKKDEQASGEYLTQALNSIAQLKSAVDSGQITDLGQARSIFENQILATFTQQINGLKTASVRESRLTNQVRDLRKNFEDLIPPSLAAAITRQQTSATNALNFSRQIPEFATGGYVGGVDRGFDSVQALVRPGELILNRQQQNAVMAQSNPNVFRNAGVPAVNATGAYASGGFVPSGGQPIEITLDAQVVISEKTATGIYVVGGSSTSGRAVTVNNVKIAKTNREL